MDLRTPKITLLLVLLSGVQASTTLALGDPAGAGPCLVGTPLDQPCDAVPWEGCCAAGHVLWCAPDGSTLCALACAEGPCGFSLAREVYDCDTTGLPDPTGVHPLACEWSCTPDCDGKACGPDGCLGSCGSCPPESPACDAAGQCVACVPDCAGRECGLGDCGAWCGLCPAGEVCGPDGQCCAPDCAGATCGPDGCGGSCGACGWPSVCGAQRTCETCGCGARVCGTDVCGASCGTCPTGEACTAAGQCVPVPAGCHPGGVGGMGEGGEGCTASVCPGDPWCCTIAWDAICAGACQQTGACAPAVCVPDCQGRVCGDTDGCGGSCGACPSGMRCAGFGAKCLPCTCSGKECGDDGCGASCGICGAGEVCAKGSCVPLGCGATDTPGCAGCGCEACVCANDPACCTVVWDQTCANACRYECQGCPCIPDCDGRECGWTGCGYKKVTCGTCPGDSSCTLDGLCCHGVCTGKECGGDGCGGLCGTCPAGAVCHGIKCVCVPVCEGKSCGPDGCGGSCGACPDGTACRGGACEPDYPAACLGASLPSADACPAGLGFEGCCDADGRVVWCEGGVLHCLACLPADGCGWRTQRPDGTPAGYTDCGGQGVAPPEEPVSCGALCVPHCAEHSCGDDGCGGACPPGCAAGVPCVDGGCATPVDAGSADAGVGADADASTDASEDGSSGGGAADAGGSDSAGWDASADTAVVDAGVPDVSDASPVVDGVVPGDTGPPSDASPGADAAHLDGGSPEDASAADGAAGADGSDGAGIVDDAVPADAADGGPRRPDADPPPGPADAVAPVDTQPTLDGTEAACDPARTDCEETNPTPEATGRAGAGGCDGCGSSTGEPPSGAARGGLALFSLLLLAVATPRSPPGRRGARRCGARAPRAPGGPPSGA